MWIFIGIVSLVAFVLLYREIRDIKLLETVTKRNRGTRTERDLVMKLLKSGIPAQTIFHDLYVKNHNEKFSQIDLVVATKAGILVLEVKDYSGWIFGRGHQSRWTQVLAYGKRRYHFYNPILQNSKHISDLKKQLRQFQNVPFYSIVVFYGNCVLKDVSFVPEGTFLVKPNRILAVIQMLLESHEPARYTDKNEIVRILKEAVKNGEDQEIQIQHIRNVNEMLGKDRIFE
jgi:hypothetical protein